MSENKNNLMISKEVDLVLPLVESFGKMFPTTANKEEDTRLMMNFALALNGVKTKSGQPAVSVCTKESIYQCGLDILNKKLDLSKNQVYLIAYGDKLQLQDSYFGRVALVKRELGISIRGSVIHEGDDIQISVDETGLKHITQKTTWKNINNKIVGAYAIAYDSENKVIESDIMTFTEIWTSWLQSQGGVKDTHKKFPNEMARKTVEGRLAKHIYQKYSDGSIGFDYEENDVEIPEERENVIDLNNIEETQNNVDNNTTHTEPAEPVVDVVQESFEQPTPTYDYEQPNVESYNVGPEPEPQPQSYNNFNQPQDNKVKGETSLETILANAQKGEQVRVPYGRAKELAMANTWKLVTNSYDPATKSILVERL